MTDDEDVLELPCIELPDFSRSKARRIIQELVFACYGVCDRNARTAKLRYDAIYDLSERLGLGRDYEEWT